MYLIKELNMLIWKIFKEHPESTKNPQGYWEHGLFSVVNSVKGLWYMILGIIHGIIPCLFPFATSSFIIRSFCKLVQSNRHIGELEEYLSDEIKAKINGLKYCGEYDVQ